MCPFIAQRANWVSSSAIELKRGLDRGCAVAVKALGELSRPVTTRQQKEQIATVSAHNDRTIGVIWESGAERAFADLKAHLRKEFGVDVRISAVE